MYIVARVTTSLCCTRATLVARSKPCRAMTFGSAHQQPRTQLHAIAHSCTQLHTDARTCWGRRQTAMVGMGVHLHRAGEPAHRAGLAVESPHLNKAKGSEQTG